jgi:hypothetical protein
LYTVPTRVYTSSRQAGIFSLHSCFPLSSASASS